MIFLFFNLSNIQNWKKKDKFNINPEINFKWKPSGHRIKTRWAFNLDQNNIWEEYPRPQLQRKEWINLNGLWKYSIGNSSNSCEYTFEGYILVPFPIESSLSGVMTNLTKDQFICYQTQFDFPVEWKNKHILLNFGAVDWKCEVYINQQLVGNHTGGYSYFYFDITKFLMKRKNNILLKVTDNSDTFYSTPENFQPIGKQSINPRRIFYTSSSGIWQTVWIEPVNENYIENLEINNDYDNKEIKVTFKVANNIQMKIKFFFFFKDKLVKKAYGKSNQKIIIKLSNKNFHPWSPSEPNLYIIKAKLLTNFGFEMDSITSYTSIRKIESKRDNNKILRIFLNNKPLFNLGTLDQGYWPDGLYTPPSEDAMIYDIKKLKELGFNTIRKHAKVESLRYYYQCDKIGMLVWQDMPSGNMDNSTKWNKSHINGGNDTIRTEFSKNNYYKEWGEIIENLKFFQCIIIWIPFNEAWGQFDTEKVVEFTKRKDNTRLIDAASGGNHRICGDFLDLHHYPNPDYFLKYADLINIFGEYGGLSLKINNHTWNEINWGYEVVNDRNQLTAKYIEYINDIIKMIPQGISAAIYTQTTDVESEINGLMTYDRNETKVFNIIKEYNQKLILSLS